MELIDRNKLIKFKLESSKKFNPEEHCDRDECFYIEIDDDHRTMIEDYQSLFTSSGSTNQLSKGDLNNINLMLWMGEDSVGIEFQKITSSKTLNKGSFLGVSNNNFTVSKEGIQISNKIDAYFDGDNRLYFKSFSRIKSLFPGIEDYFRIATNQEVSQFKRFSIADVQQFDIGERNRKMIALIMDDDELNLDDPDFQRKLLLQYDNYKENVTFLKENGRFFINTNTQLNELLKLILGRFYENPITSHKMEASSARKI